MSPAGRPSGMLRHCPLTPLQLVRTKKNRIQHSCNNACCFYPDLRLNGKSPMATVNHRQVHSTPIMRHIDSQSDQIGIHSNLSWFMNDWRGVDRLETDAASNHPLNCLSCHMPFPLNRVLSSHPLNNFPHHNNHLIIHPVFPDNSFPPSFHITAGGSKPSRN